jgi:putative lipase involved disintegration of autophagic bodies
MLSLTFGVPCVTFEAVPELLAATRLHLPLPPADDDGARGASVHVWHTADPIAQGGGLQFPLRSTAGRASYLINGDPSL